MALGSILKCYHAFLTEQFTSRKQDLSYTRSHAHSHQFQCTIHNFLHSRTVVGNNQLQLTMVRCWSICLGRCRVAAHHVMPRGAPRLTSVWPGEKFLQGFDSLPRRSALSQPSPSTDPPGFFPKHNSPKCRQRPRAPAAQRARSPSPRAKRKMHCRLW